MADIAILIVRYKKNWRVMLDNHGESVLKGL